MKRMDGLNSPDIEGSVAYALYEHAQAFTGIPPVLHSTWLQNMCSKTEPSELLAHRHTLRCDGSGCRMAPAMMIMRKDAFTSLCCLYCCGLYTNLFWYSGLLAKNSSMKQQKRVILCCLVICPLLLAFFPLILIMML